METKSRAPHIVHKIPVNTVNKVMEIRKLSNRNEYAIASYLNRQAILVNHSTVYRILKKNGLINPLSKPRQQRTFKRFSRKHSNSLWQTDLTIFGSWYMAAFIDDHSRFLTGIGFIPKATVDSVLSVFEQAIDAFGKPRQILTDYEELYQLFSQISKIKEHSKQNQIRNRPHSKKFRRYSISKKWYRNII